MPPLDTAFGTIGTATGTAQGWRTMFHDAAHRRRMEEINNLINAARERTETPPAAAARPAPEPIRVRIEEVPQATGINFYNITAYRGTRQLDQWGWFESLEQARRAYDEITTMYENQLADEANRTDGTRIRVDVRARNNLRRRNRPMNRDDRRRYHNPKEDTENEFTINEELIAAEEQREAQTPRRTTMRAQVPDFEDLGFGPLEIEDDFI